MWSGGRSKPVDRFAGGFGEYAFLLQHRFRIRGVNLHLMGVLHGGLFPKSLLRSGTTHFRILKPHRYFDRSIQSGN